MNVKMQYNYRDSYQERDSNPQHRERKDDDDLLRRRYKSREDSRKDTKFRERGGRRSDKRHGDREWKRWPLDNTGKYLSDLYLGIMVW